MQNTAESSITERLAIVRWATKGAAGAWTEVGHGFLLVEGLTEYTHPSVSASVLLWMPLVVT
jgi:hypothetical protein